MKSQWKAWYDDGAVYNSVEHAWADLPEDGFLIRMVFKENGGREWQMGVDFYFDAVGSDGKIIPGTGMEKDDIPNRYFDGESGTNIKRGRRCSDEMWAEVHEAARVSKAP